MNRPLHSDPAQFQHVLRAPELQIAFRGRSPGWRDLRSPSMTRTAYISPGSALRAPASRSHCLNRGSLNR